MVDKVSITIDGELDRRWANHFENLVLDYTENTTNITGFLRDEAHLHGLLNRIRDLNLKLISVKRSITKNNYYEKF